MSAGPVIPGIFGDASLWWKHDRTVAAPLATVGSERRKRSCRLVVPRPHLGIEDEGRRAGGKRLLAIPLVRAPANQENSLGTGQKRSRTENRARETPANGDSRVAGFIVQRRLYRLAESIPTSSLPTSLSTTLPSKISRAISVRYIYMNLPHVYSQWSEYIGTG